MRRHAEGGRLHGGDDVPRKPAREDVIVHQQLLRLAHDVVQQVDEPEAAAGVRAGDELLHQADDVLVHLHVVHRQEGEILNARPTHRHAHHRHRAKLQTKVFKIKRLIK